MEHLKHFIAFQCLLPQGREGELIGRWGLQTQPGSLNPKLSHGSEVVPHALLAR